MMIQDNYLPRKRQSSCKFLLHKVSILGNKKEVSNSFLFKIRVLTSVCGR